MLVERTEPAEYRSATVADLQQYQDHAAYKEMAVAPFGEVWLAEGAREGGGREGGPFQQLQGPAAGAGVTLESAVLDTSSYFCCMGLSSPRSFCLPFH